MKLGFRNGGADVLQLGSLMRAIYSLAFLRKERPRPRDPDRYRPPYRMEGPKTAQTALSPLNFKLNAEQALL